MSLVKDLYRSEPVVGSRRRRRTLDWRPLVAAGAVVLVAAACSSDDDASAGASTETTIEATTTSTAAPVTSSTAASDTSAAPLEVPLPTDVTEAYSIPSFGYSIEYPSGWFVQTIEPVTNFGQIEEDLFSDPDVGSEGLGVAVDHRTVAFLQEEAGLVSDDPTAQDLVDFNITNFGWMDVRDQEDVEVFGSPAIKVRASYPNGDEGVAYQGIRFDTGEVFILRFDAPSSEILEDFLPTWDVMLESITAVGEAEQSADGGDLSSAEAFADGTYAMGQLGIPVTFTVTGKWSTQPVGTGFFVITTPDSAGPGDHDIVAFAPTELFDATTGEPSLAADDLAGWVDRVPATVTVSEPAIGEIGGFPTSVFTVEVAEETACTSENGGCVDFALIGRVFGKSFDPGFVYEVHFVDHPDGPIAFVLGTPSDDVAWLDTARAVVATIELG
ncbi:MAG: hypothetical protein ACI8TP_001717 [Acidimicrobiales bacterium]|jgi:hypothetical protein